MKIKETIEIKGIHCVKSDDEQVGKEQKFSDIAFVAADCLWKELEWDKSDIRAILLVTQTSDYLIPSTASLIQKRLGVGVECLVYDLNLGGNGFVMGMQACAKILSMCELGSKALIVCGEAFREEKIKLAAAIGVELSDNAQLIGESVTVPNTFHWIEQKEKYSSTIYKENYICTIQNIVNEILCKDEYKQFLLKDINLLSNENLDWKSNPIINMQHTQYMEEHMEIILERKDNSALIPYLICLQENVYDNMIVTVGAGMVVSVLMLMLNENIYTAVSSTNEVYYDIIKED